MTNQASSIRIELYANVFEKGKQHVIDTVLFDIGGTLITQSHDDGRLLIFTRYARSLLGDAIPAGMTDGELSALIRDGAETYKHWGEQTKVELRPVQIWRDHILRSFDIPEDRIAVAAESLSFCNDYIRLINKPREGLRKMLEELRAMGLKVGVVTNTISLTFADHILKEFGVSDLIQDIVKSCDVGIRKPDAGIFDIAMRRIGSVKETTCYVGDTISRDILGSRNAGLAMCIQIRNPSVAHRDKDFQGPGAPKADHIIDSLTEIPGIIREHNKAVR